MDLFKNASRLATSSWIQRYLVSCTEQHWDVAEAAANLRHLCRYYVAAVRGIADPETVQERSKDYVAVRSATSALPDFMAVLIGSAGTGVPDHERLAETFFDELHKLACEALGVSGPNPDVAAMADDMLEMAVMIADASMEELVRSHGISSEADDDVIQMFSESGKRAGRLADADPALVEGFEWLYARGLATTRSSPGGTLVVLTAVADGETPSTATH